MMGWSVFFFSLLSIYFVGLVLLITWIALRPVKPLETNEPTTGLCVGCGSESTVDGTVKSLGWQPKDIGHLVLTLGTPGIRHEKRVRACASCGLVWTWINTDEVNRTLNKWASKELRRRLAAAEPDVSRSGRPRITLHPLWKLLFFFIAFVGLVAFLNLAIDLGENLLPVNLLLGTIFVLGVLPVLILVPLDVSRGEYQVRPVKPCPNCGGTRCVWGRFEAGSEDNIDGPLWSWENTWKPVQTGQSLLHRGKMAQLQLGCLSCGCVSTTLHMLGPHAGGPRPAQTTPPSRRVVS